ncbi:IQ motif-containing protein H isoform X1 [Pygocentrus nattereri]|uniref:IQ motif-containing protein H isoform X1 n=1 Tax=Pygocentrus nattereri TaxID=42514 RepID=UPI001890FC38|nr:IQ motif-containing protein H isoform X1 [Pygocentrus nattereri]
MSDIPHKRDELGRILVQVRNDLTELRKRLGRTAVREQGQTLDIDALDAAISRTEDGIKTRAEEYLKTVNKQVLTLPIIEDLEKKTKKIAKWRPPLETIPDMRPQKYLTAGASPGEKHKAAFTMRLLYNPAHPKNRELMHQAYGIQFPDLRKKTGTTVGTQKVVSGLTLGSLAVVPTGFQGSNPYPPPPLCEEDMRAGIASLVEKGLPPSVADLCLVRTPVKPKVTYLHQREGGSPNRIGVCERVGKRQKDVSQSKDVMQAPRISHPERPLTRTIVTPPPSAASDSKLPQGPARLTPLNCQCAPALPPAPVSKHCFNIVGGQIDPCAADFCTFKEHYCLCWGPLVEVLWQLERLMREYAVPHARVCGERLVALVQSGELDWGSGDMEQLLLTLENKEEVWELVKQPGQRYKGEGGRQAAAVRIQACWRRHQARTAYLEKQRRKWAAGTIAISWLLHAQVRRVRKSLQVTRLRHLENYRSRAEYLEANWSRLSTCRRTIIHVPSLGYSEQQRRSLQGFDILQNTQMGRLCDVKDENVEVIYVCPVQLGEDLLHYYTQLLGLQGAVETGEPTALPASCTKRFTILTPEAYQYFPSHKMCVSTLLKYSPHTLQRIKYLIQGKQAYLVSGVPHIDDLAVADELGVPVLGPEPAVAQLYGTKSGVRRIFTSAGVSVPPGHGDIYTLQQLHECLAQLMTDHLQVQCWLFKMDGEVGSRGTAYCDVSHLSFRPWALQEYHCRGPQLWRMAWAQEPVLLKCLEAVPALLASHAKPFNTSCYPTWTCFIEHFLKQGGVIEACPPSDSVTCLTVDLLVEPGGEVNMLSCGDQLHGPGGLQVAGYTVPQTSVSSDTLYSICMRVGHACQQRRILGYLSLDLVTFLEPSSLEQQVWAVDLDIGYSNQLAMTQLMLLMTGGTLSYRTGRLEVPPPVRANKPTARQKASVTTRFAVMSSQLLHTNLSMVRYSVFFQMCKAQGIGFDIKERQGSVFALHDSVERSSLSMVTISPDLQGALLTFARNLSVIHQEISAPNMQGETNFKDLIKNIEEVVGVTVQNSDKDHKEEPVQVCAVIAMHC